MILYLDVQRAAEATSMSPRWIRQQIKDGLPCLRTEGKILLDPDEIRKWMVSHFTPKVVDLPSAFEMAEQLTSGRRQRRKKVIQHKEEVNG